MTKPTTIDPVAETVYGRVRGGVEGGVSVFRGVPYAAAPTGALRYRPPEPPEAWGGVRDATAFGPSAPQLSGGELFDAGVPWGEDCLTLNVWTPAAGGAARPVIVWIHGGGFLFGTGADPIVGTGAFARDGVVFVSINYRLGGDGFLYVPDDPDGGNYGVLDQVAALRWVRDNIAAFGGDPARVTLAGQSAGATAVGALLAVPAARGLFARAIVQSGYPDPLLSSESAEITTREIYARLDLPYGDLDALRALREREPERVLRAQMALFGEVLATRDVRRFGAEIAIPGNPFQPVVGGRVLPERPVQALEAAEPAPFDLLIGYNADEFGLMYGIGMLAADDAPGPVAAAFDRAFAGGGAEALRAYRSARPDASGLDLLTALDTDRGYRLPLARIADAHAATGAATYAYRFAWRSRAFGGAIGAGHSVEKPFVFDALDLPQSRRFTGDDPPQRLADAMHRAWVAFAATGDPGHTGIPEWPRYDPAAPTTLAFGERDQVVHDPEPAERKLWNGLAAVERSG
ncbi:carboxylesterase/lipase family protein [Actinomadura montaniterrae]|uniref:carboxylesterase/lipase family protein n=1 Tax=Actinomadura montaniterrae TaxID=1803903 RepID=UPI001CEF5A09|nr:carboxylesterase family protein [Actinomadura montaniterrae]